MRRFIAPISAFLAVALPTAALAQSVSSSSLSSASSMSSMSSMSSTSSMSSMSSSMSSLSSSRSSLSSSRSSSKSSVSSSRVSSSRNSSSSSFRGTWLDFEDIDLDRYSDAPWDDASVNIAVSALTHIGVLRGNDDGTFRASRTLNRAEFVEIVMRLLDDDSRVNTNCFVDVRPTEWYAESVCRAKALGIVRGNARAGVDEDMWRFEASRDVQYEEAVKVLAKIYALPVDGDEEGMDWYVPFIEAAEDEDLTIEGLVPGDRLTRAEMARLAVAFAAHASGQLDDLRDAEENATRSSRSSSRMSSTSSRSSTSTSRSSGSSRSSIGSGIFDPDDNTSVRSQVIALGEVSPVLAWVKFFNNLEPVEVDAITVELANDVDSVSSIIIYDEDGQQLGTATNTSGNGTTFRAVIPADRFEVPQRVDTSIYVRARLKDDDAGGESGEEIEVESVTVEGVGSWSDSVYDDMSNDTFQTFVTAEAVLESVVNAGSSTAILTNGTERIIGEFRFNANNADGDAEVRLTDLRFNINQTGNVTLSNVFLSTEGESMESSCSVSSNTITCSSIPSSIGSVDEERTIRVYADVNVPVSSTNARLQISLNNAGSPSSQGSVTWSDGTNSFNWIGTNEPVANGTIYQ